MSKKSFTPLEVLSLERRKSKLLTGFTLLELVLVLVIIGIIAAFATPGYLGAKQRAEQRQAATQVRLIYTAEKVRFLESDRYALCTGYVSCNNALNLDLPDDGWAYKVTTSSSKLNFKVSASKGGCTYSMTESSTKPTASAGCVYIP